MRAIAPGNACYLRQRGAILLGHFQRYTAVELGLTEPAPSTCGCFKYSNTIITEPILSERLAATCKGMCDCSFGKHCPLAPEQGLNAFATMC